mmetsp:Transcript_52384/g.147533  ORF Transcript_52384/g.147533 Transcript_52384/m.147533 type:complete len:81 (-) Transcript_52384:196-438(-)
MSTTAAAIQTKRTLGHSVFQGKFWRAICWKNLISRASAPKFLLQTCQKGSATKKWMAVITKFDMLGKVPNTASGTAKSLR